MLRTWTSKSGSLTANKPTPTPTPTTTMNHYTDSRAKNRLKKNSRSKIAFHIKNDKKAKVIHHLGGKNPHTPFEKYFKLGGRTTFIRYEFKENTPIPNNYIEQKEFVEKDKIQSVLEIVESRGLKWQATCMRKLLKEYDDKYGCFVNGNIFSNYMKYVEKFEHDPHYFWLDFCCAPTPSVLKETKQIVDLKQAKMVFCTFYMNHRGKNSVKKIIGGDKTPLDTRVKNLNDHFKKMLGNEFTCSVFDTYINGIAPMCVLKIERKGKIQTKKTIEDYAKASKRFSNKQLAILWKMPIMKIAGLAAAAKRYKLIK